MEPLTTCLRLFSNSYKCSRRLGMALVNATVDATFPFKSRTNPECLQRIIVALAQMRASTPTSSSTCLSSLFRFRNVIPRLHSIRAIAAPFDRPRRIYWVQPALVEIDKEYHVVAEAAYACQSGHSNYERKQVVDESIQTLVNQDSPR
jgi:hypothetical protein